MSAAASPVFDQHRSLYPSRPPNLLRLQQRDELEQIEGLVDLPMGGFGACVRGRVPVHRGDSLAEQSKYLWAVAEGSVPIALENGKLAERLARGRLSHTNLTGGAPAHTAGELWFLEEGRVVINGGSSRYTPRSPDELQSVAKSFKLAGYEVASMGWDEEVAAPERIARGELSWL